MSKELPQKQIPVLPLRDVVVFPHIVMPLYVGRTKSIRSLDEAMDSGKDILLVTQKEANLEEPTAKDIYQIGTVATIIQLLKLPDGTVKVLVEGKSRAKVLSFESEEYYSAEISEITEIVDNDVELDVIQTTVLTELDKFAHQQHNKVKPEVLTALKDIHDPKKLVDTLAGNIPFSLEKKQTLLEQDNVFARFEMLLGLIQAEMEISSLDKKIRDRVKKQMEKNQRDYYLNEQIKAIQKELGEVETVENEVQQLKKKIADAKMPKEVQEKAESELQKLKMMSPMSAEATVVRTYIDWMVQVPWHKRTKVKKDLKQAEEILNNDHYGLERVKERILEYLAVQTRTNQIRGPILCLVGPPGVGKTSLGQSIAQATGRKYVRIALGGVRDDRRSYIGALPGKLIQNMAKVGVKNPLFLLDEIDKLGADMRGDPASALLEVLDPEQNNTFSDHYLEVDYDLSDVMFVATSNSMNIPGPLLDRMEVIRLSGYTEDEKLNIAMRHLLNKQMERNGLKAKELIVKEEAILDIIRYYTREAGVRNLEREISKICRKAVKNLLLDKSLKQVVVDSSNLHDYLGVRRFEYGKADNQNRVGEVTGLAWTEVGGDLLTIEAASVSGKGKLNYTGSLGDVMKESIQAAMTVVRARAEQLGINADFYEKRDIHIHVPEGATPKDGPSAGIAMCTALVSCLTGNPVRADVAMTGEITLRGKVLPIGGLKEKLLAAHRGGIKRVLIPKDNVKDLEEIPENAKSALDIRPVETIDEVLALALEKPPVGIEVVKNLAAPKKRSSKNMTSTVN